MLAARRTRLPNDLTSVALPRREAAWQRRLHAMVGHAYFKRRNIKTKILKPVRQANRHNGMSKQ